VVERLAGQKHILMTRQRSQQGHTVAHPDEAIAAYQLALEGLPGQKTDDSHLKVMSALITRDDLACSLSDARHVISEELSRITELDQRLKESAPTIVAIVGASTLANWRETVQPPAGAWWWHLDERAAAAEPKPHPLWAILAGFCITVSLSLSADISRRFLSVGPDFLGVFSTLSQALLALLAGSALTRIGRQAVERGLARLGIARTFHHPWKAGLALAVLLAILGLRFALPAFAYYYNEAGLGRQAEGRVTSAIEQYQRAISLAPTTRKRTLTWAQPTRMCWNTIRH
jgi:tetratricopeptide (TPR) repeat protein